MSWTRVHRWLAIVLVVPLVVWSVSGLLFHLKPGWGRAYDMLDAERPALSTTSVAPIATIAATFPSKISKIELFDKDNFQSYAAQAPNWMTNIINAYGGNPYAHLVAMGRRAQQDGVIKGILLQKPMTTNLADAREIVRLCEEAGIVLSINQNMRYDQSMRALKTLLDRGYLGEPVVSQITMHARPHWQEFIKGYDRVAILNMSIHHLDVFRFLYGDPESITVSVRPGSPE